MLNSLNYSKRSLEEERERERRKKRRWKKEGGGDHRPNDRDDDYSDRVPREPLLAIRCLQGGILTAFRSNSSSGVSRRDKIRSRTLGRTEQNPQFGMPLTAYYIKIRFLLFK